MRKPQTKEQYIEQLRKVLGEYKAKNIDDIIEDYEEYFAHSVAKGYSIKESIHRLPSVEKLALSYREDSGDGPVQLPAEDRVPFARRTLLFVIMILGELLLLPFLLVAGLFFASVGVAGLASIVGGILVLVPREMLGDVMVPHPSILYILPTVTLLVAGGVSVLGMTLVIAERTYGALRASLLMKKWMLTGKHGDHLKLIPPISKKVRQILYGIVLFAGLAALLAVLVLIVTSLITSGSADFMRSWNVS